MRANLQKLRTRPIVRIMPLCFFASLFFLSGCGGRATSPDDLQDKSKSPGKDQSVSDSTEMGTPDNHGETDEEEKEPIVKGLPEGFTLQPDLTIFTSEYRGRPELQIRWRFLKDDDALKVIKHDDLRLETATLGSHQLKQIVTSGQFPLNYQRSGESISFWNRTDGQSTAILFSRFELPIQDSDQKIHVKGRLNISFARKQELKRIPSLVDALDASPQEIQERGYAVFEAGKHHFHREKSFSIIFSKDRFVTIGSLIDQSGKVLDAPLLDHLGIKATTLPDGRFHVLVTCDEERPSGELQFFFIEHSEIEEAELEFDFPNLQCPTLSQPLTSIQQVLSNWVESTTPMDRPISHKVLSQAMWSRTRTLRNRQLTQRPLQLFVDILGDKAAHTIAVGDIDVESIRGGEENDLKPHINVNNNQHSQGEFSPYRPQIYAPDVPKFGARLLCEFDPKDKSLDLIDEFQGSVTLLTVEEQQSFVVDDLLAFLGKEVQHEKLQQNSISLTPEMFGPGLNVSMGGDQPFAVAKIDALDVSGARSNSMYSGRQIFNGKAVFSFHAQDKFPEKLPVRIWINKGLEEVTVPFAFENIPVAPAPDPRPLAAP